MSASAASPSTHTEPRSPLLKAASLSGDRVSRLQGMFEQMAGQIGEALDQLSPSPIELAVSELTTGNSAEVLEGLGESAAIGVYRFPDRELHVLIVADGPAVDAALEAVLGADGSEPAGDRQRPLTAIETRMLAGVFDAVAAELHGIFLGQETPPLELEAIETSESLPPKAGQCAAAVRARLGLSTLERNGELLVLIPQEALQGAQQGSAASPPPRPAPRDPHWSQRIEQELQRTQVTLHAVLDECALSLAEIAELRVGQVIPLRATPRSQVKVICNDQAVFWCELGQAEGVYTVRVKDFADEEQELVNALLSL